MGSRHVILVLLFGGLIRLIVIVVILLVFSATITAGRYRESQPGALIRDPSPGLLSACPCRFVRLS